MEKFSEYEQDRPKLKTELNCHLDQFVGGIIKNLALSGYVVCVPQCREISNEDWVGLRGTFNNGSRNIREYLTKAGEGETEIETILSGGNHDRSRADFLDLVLAFFYRAIEGESAVEFWCYYGSL